MKLLVVSALLLCSASLPTQTVAHVKAVAHTEQSISVRCSKIF